MGGSAAHAADHIHIVATLARQDGTRPKTWNDFYRVREACQEAGMPAGCGRLDCSGGSYRRTARHPGGDGAGSPARLGRTGPE